MIIPGAGGETKNPSLATCSRWQPEAKPFFDLLRHRNQSCALHLVLSSKVRSSNGFQIEIILAKCRWPRIKISISEAPGVNCRAGQPCNCSGIFLGPLYAHRQGLFVCLFLRYQILKLLPWFKSARAICVTSVAKQIQEIPRNLIIMCQPQMRATFFIPMNNAFSMRPFHSSNLKMAACIFLPIPRFCSVWSLVPRLAVTSGCTDERRPAERHEHSGSLSTHSPSEKAFHLQTEIMFSLTRTHLVALLKYTIFHLFQALVPIDV